jgi:hypothetical protein
MHEINRYNPSIFFNTTGTHAGSSEPLAVHKYTCADGPIAKGKADSEPTNRFGE